MPNLQRTEARRDLAQFVRERRSRIKPQDVGLAPGARRRTPGLRREEVAQLVGVSVTWYTWFEQGRDIQVSTDFLDRVSSAFRLDSRERVVLFELANHQPPTPAPAVPTLVASQELARTGERRATAATGSRQALVAVHSAAELETYRINEAIRKVIADEEGRPPQHLPAVPSPAARPRRRMRWAISLALVGILMLVPHHLVLS